MLQAASFIFMPIEDQRLHFSPTAVSLILQDNRYNTLIFFFSK